MKLRKSRRSSSASQHHFVPQDSYSIKMKEVGWIAYVVFLTFVSTTTTTEEKTRVSRQVFSPLIYQQQQRQPQPFSTYAFWLNTAATGGHGLNYTAYQVPLQVQVYPMNTPYTYVHGHSQNQQYLYRLPSSWNNLLSPSYLGHRQPQLQHQSWPQLTYPHQQSYYGQYYQQIQQLQQQQQMQQQQQLQQQQMQWQRPHQQIQHVHIPHQQQFIHHQQRPTPAPHQEIGDFGHQNPSIGQGHVHGHHTTDDAEIVEAAHDANTLQHDDHVNMPTHHLVNNQTHRLPPRDFSDYNFDFSNVGVGSKKPLEVDSSNHHHLSFQRGHVESMAVTNTANANANIRGSISSAGEWNALTKPEPELIANGGFNRAAVESRGSTAGMSWKERSALTTYQSQQNNYRVVCYFANWGWFRDENAGQYIPEFLDTKLCTHIIYAYASYDRSKISIKPSEPSVDIDNKFYERVVKLKLRNPALKVILAVGGWADSGENKYSALANSEINRRKFARETVTFLKKYGFDGISMDWHYPVCWQSDCHKGPKSDKTGFTDLLYELKMALAPEGLLVVASLSGYKEVIDTAYDVPRISEYLDFMNIMTYDYHGSWESRTGHLSPLFAGPQAEDLKRTYNSDFTMEYYVSQGADASKLVLGIPLYGQTFTLENQFDSSLGSLAVGPGQPGVFTKQEGMLSYYEICKHVREDGWKVRKGSTGSHGPYAHKGNQWVGYDDVEFVKRKALYVKTKSFGGAFVFTLDLDDFTNVCCGGDHPLLRTLADELLGIPFNSRKQGCGPISTQAPAIIRPTPPNVNPPQNVNNTPRPTQKPEQAEVVDACEYSSRPHPTDCNLYYQCTSGTEVLQRCPPNLHWNPNAMTCDWPGHAGCTSSHIVEAPPTTEAPLTTSRPRPSTRPPTTRPPPPPPPPTSTWMEPPGACYNEGEYSEAANCDQYYLCSNGIAKLQTCGPGLHWNNVKKLCDWPSEARCQLRQDSHDSSLSLRDEACSEGSFTGSPEECDVYFVCVHGHNMQFRCQSGLHWNAQLNVCDWPANAKCRVQQVGSVTESPTTTTTSSWVWITSTYYPTPTAPSSTTTIIPSPEVPSIELPAPPAPPPSPSIVPPKPQKPSVAPTQPVPPPPPVSVAPPAVQETQLSGDYKIVCYFTNWAWYRPGMAKFMPKDINADLCTHIVYGFAVLDSETLTIKPHDTWADIDNKFYEQVTALKRQGKKVTVAIGGWNDSAGDKYSRLVNSAEARRRFIQHVMEFIKKWDFDGLDLDWEYPKCWQVECNKGPDSDKPSFAAFVRELSEAFRPHNYLLSSAVSPSKTVIDAGYDVPTIARYMDWIAVMAYDFHGQWDKKTGHVAPLYFHEEDDYYFFNANYSVNYWISQGADRKKIVMGMPLYGQSFTLADPSEHGLNAPSIGGGTAGEFTRASGFLANYEICHNIQKNGWTVVKDETGAIGPYAYKGNQWVSYDDVDMIRRKSELIRKLDLGGGMIWALDLDDFRNSCGQGEYPLLNTIRSILGKPKGISDDRPSDTISSVVHEDKPSRPSVEFVDQPIEPIIPATTKRPSTKPPLKNDEIEHCSEPFRPHDKDCSKYYQCIFGRYIEQSCPPGTAWNKDRCDWPQNSDCGKPSVTPVSTSKPAVIRTTTPRPQRPSSPSPSVQTDDQHNQQQQTTVTFPAPTAISTPEYFPTEVSFPSTSYRPPRRTTTPTPTKDPEWCRLNWCPTPKPIPPNKHTPVAMKPSSYKVVCYFTNWAWYRQGSGKYKPEDINFNLCTHIIYGFAVLNPSTLVIRPHDDWADIDNQFYKQVTQLREKGIIVMLALGGWNDSLGDKYSRLVNDPTARSRFIDHAITFIEEWDFDGLDLDWEYPKCWQVDCEKGPASDKPAFATFVREIKEAFEPRGLLLSSAVSPNHRVIDEGYDVPTVSRYLDWIAVMTYDYHGQFDGRTGHNSPMYAHPEDENQYFNTNYTINYWIKNGADRKKIVMGMPMYGQSFTLVNASNTGLNSKSSGGAEAGEFTRSKGFLAYYEICNYVQKKGWTVVQDELGTMGPYAYKGDQWVSFDDIDQIRRKSEYVKKMGLGGGMIWALDLDDFRGICGCEEHPLLKTINRVLRNYPEPDPHCKF